MSDDDTQAHDRLMNISLSVELGSYILDLIITGIPKSTFIYQSNLYYNLWMVLCNSIHSYMCYNPPRYGRDVKAVNGHMEEDR